MDRPYTHTTLRVKAGQEDEFVKRWTEWADWSHRQGLETEARLLRDAENPQTFVSFAPWKNVSTVRSWRGQKEIDRVLKQDPRHIQTLVFRGYLQGRQGRHDRALKDFSKALELNPNVVSAVIGRGWTYVMLKRYGEALADF
jgi:tetratricopeptide (TPR) repeat protein